MSTTRQRAIARLELLAETTAEFGELEALGATAATLARRLQSQWPEVEPTQLYRPFEIAREQVITPSLFDSRLARAYTTLKGLSVSDALDGS
jgi:hypothetical protein